MTDHDCNQEHRERGYRAVFDFYILFDRELNANHFRFYGQIEQMESSPNPNVTPRFSYNWIAKILGINRRNAINVANKLKEKGYIQRTETEDGEHLWSTCRGQVLVSPSDTPLVSPSDTPLVSPSDTLNKLNKTKVHKKKTTTAKRTESKPKNPVKQSSSSEISDSEKLEFLSLKLAEDERTEELFIQHCLFHLLISKEKGFNKPRRKSGLLKILTQCYETDTIFEAHGYEEQQKINRIKNETDEQRQERQFFEYEIAKEKEGNGYISEHLERFPHMREKYA